jgi:hypothetical protein
VIRKPRASIANRNIPVVVMIYQKF